MNTPPDEGYETKIKLPLRFKTFRYIQDLLGVFCFTLGTGSEDDPYEFELGSQDRFWETLYYFYEYVEYPVRLKEDSPKIGPYLRTMFEMLKFYFDSASKKDKLYRLARKNLARFSLPKHVPTPIKHIFGDMEEKINEITNVQTLPILIDFLPVEDATKVKFRKSVAMSEVFNSINEMSRHMLTIMNLSPQKKDGLFFEQKTLIATDLMNINEFTDSVKRAQKLLSLLKTTDNDTGLAMDLVKFKNRWNLSLIHLEKNETETAFCHIMMTNPKIWLLYLYGISFIENLKKENYLITNSDDWFLKTSLKNSKGVFKIDYKWKVTGTNIPISDLVKHTVNYNLDDLSLAMQCYNVYSAYKILKILFTFPPKDEPLTTKISLIGFSEKKKLNGAKKYIHRKLEVDSTGWILFKSTSIKINRNSIYTQIFSGRSNERVGNVFNVFLLSLLVNEKRLRILRCHTSLWKLRCFLPFQFNLKTEFDTKLKNGEK
jgi:hypothetical protein